MQDHDLDPGDPQTWIDRGRSVEDARDVAAAWREFPDLPNDAPLADRQARMRLRGHALRVVSDRISARLEAQRQETNFRCIERQLAEGTGDKREIAILRGRDVFGLDWDGCAGFAAGWLAAHFGWRFQLPTRLDGRVDERSAPGYRRGFADAGGRVDELFDQARREFVAAERMSNLPAVAVEPSGPKPMPSTWLKPTDAPRPTSRNRRLLIISASAEQRTGCRRPAVELYDDAHYRLLRGDAAYHEYLIIVLSARHGFIAGDDEIEPHAEDMSAARSGELASDPQQGDRLRALLGGREPEDLLIAVADEHLPVVDAHAAALPLCRTMERIQNAPLQRRNHIKTWLSRSIAPGANVGSGHIRWSKTLPSLTGRLGEFKTRYAGHTRGRGHVIVVELDDGTPADGFVTASGQALEPEVVVTNKARLRPAMESALRAFGGATRLMAGSADIRCISALPAQLELVAA